MAKKYIVLPTHHVDNALRLPAMWAECVGGVKEAEEIAKELAFKHAKAYTVLYVVSTFNLSIGDPEATEFLQYIIDGFTK